MSDDECPGCDERQARASALIAYFRRAKSPISPAEAAEAAEDFLGEQ